MDESYLDIMTIKMYTITLLQYGDSLDGYRLIKSKINNRSILCYG